MKLNESLESIKSKICKNNNEEYQAIFNNKYDSGNVSDNNLVFENNNNDNIKYNNSWDFYFSQKLQFNFTIEGLNQLKREIFHFYINMFCFDEKEIKVKNDYMLGLTSVNELDEVTKVSTKNECIQLICQIFQKKELEKIRKKNEFFKLFKHYFIWCLNKSFIIGKIKNKYLNTKFMFESIEKVVDNMYENEEIFNKEINIKSSGNTIENYIKEKPRDSKIEILNDDKIPALYYELNELSNDEKTYCVIKAIIDENLSYYQGAIYNKEYKNIETLTSVYTKSINENKNSNENRINDNKNNDNKKVDNKKVINKSSFNKNSYTKNNDNKNNNTKNSENKSSNNKSVDNISDNNKSVDNKSNDNKSNDNKSNNNKSNNNKSNNNKSYDNKSNDDKSNDNKSNNSKYKSNEDKINENENKNYDNKSNDNKNNENRSNDNKSNNKRTYTISHKINTNNNNNTNKENKKQKHGLGKEYHLKIKNSEDIRYKYLGYYKNNKFHGYGILVKENEELYYGEFREGLKNGFGYLQTKQYIYKGFFHADKKEGYGEYFNKEEGINYCGNFINDKFNGYGFYYKENKFKYIGNFIDGYLKGFGLYIWNNKEQYYGDWSDNKMNGIGIYFYKDGDIFIGNYLNDKKNGKGIYLYNKNKSKLEGVWKKGLKHGEYIFTYYENGNTNSVKLRYINNKEVN